MYNFKTKNLKYNMHNLICIASARVIASIDQFDLVFSRTGCKSLQRWAQYLQRKIPNKKYIFYKKYF